MRKLILPLLMVGAVAFTASSAFAGSFTEEYVPQAEGGQNVYKQTDVVDSGHAQGDFQLSSAVLKDLANGVVDGDESFGYTTGFSPFVPGIADGNETVGLNNSGVPKYTSPCPNIEVGAPLRGPNQYYAGSPAMGEGPLDLNGTAAGGCPANTWATDPQTEHDRNGAGGQLLDDLYQTVGVDDSGIDSNGDPRTRFLTQALDILVFIGNEAIVYDGNTKLGDANGDGILDAPTGAGLVTASGGTTAGFHFNIDQTLDQDVADWVTTSGYGETMGVFNKLTQLFQIAGGVSTHAQTGWAGFVNGGSGFVGCASAGYSAADEGHNSNPCTAGTNVNYRTGADGVVSADGLHALAIDQWLVSDMYDWTTIDPLDPASHDGKITGLGVAQGYSSWYKIGTGKDWDYKYNYAGGHGDINKTVSLGHDHIDP